MTEKGCDNCYYTYFDERAYPCSLCIRGIERTDMWQPSKKTKADRKTEPQKDGYMTAEQAEDYRKMLDKAEHKVYGNIEDEPQKDCLTCRYSSDEWDSPKCDGCSKAHSNYEP